jgi:hypothetical protein
MVRPGDAVRRDRGRQLLDRMRHSIAVDPMAIGSTPVQTSWTGTLRRAFESAGGRSRQWSPIGFHRRWG